MQLEKKFYIANSKKFVANNFSNAGFGAFFKNRTALPNLPLQSNFRPLLSSPVSQTGQKVYFRPQDLQKRPASQTQYPVEAKNQSNFVVTGILAPPAPVRRVSARNLLGSNADQEPNCPSVVEVTDKVETMANKLHLWANLPDESPSQSNVASWKPKASDLFTASSGEKEKKNYPNEENKKFDETITSSFLDNLSDTSNTPNTDNKNKENDRQPGLDEAIIVTKPSSSSESNNNQLKPSGKNVKICLNHQTSIDPNLERPPGRLNYYDSDTNTISEGIMITSNLIRRSNSEYIHKKPKSIFKIRYLIC